jgi:predicted nuclease of predicted toxin-antitoxin system
VVTKDADFRNSHLLSGSPRRLLIVTTGNITNDALLELVGASRLGPPLRTLSNPATSLS